jgi:hypothetical protein
MNIILIIILLVIILILIWALLGGKGDLTGKKEEEQREEDRTFRRRASDKEIEKEFPEAGPHPMRRKSDVAEESAPPEPDKPFKLPYGADEIIPEISRFRIYRRTLLNSEIYAAKGDYSTAISLYEGVKSRIQDIDTRFKIDANIEYLRHYKKKKEEEAKRKEEQAKRGVAGEGVAGGGNEIKITLGGSIPNGFKIDSLPENINIGLVDPTRGMDMERIVESATEKIRGELNDVRDELNRMRGETSDAAVSAQTQLAGALAGIKDHMDSAEAERQMAGVGAGVVSSSTEAGAAGNDQSEELYNLKKDFQKLNRAVREMAEARIAESETEPGVSGAKFDSRKPLIDEEAVKALMESIPRKKAPDASPIREPGTGGGAAAPGETLEDHLLRKTSEPDEGDEFELLKDYDRDTDGDALSDEEIFEKILRDDKGKGKEDFEILGEKKERRDESFTTPDEIDMRQQEDASFYRKLLSTTKRKKKELPILKVSYDFSKLPDEIGLSREKNIIEYAFYKYKPMLEKANEYIKKRKVRDAINYYKVVMSQNIPPEFKSMIRKNLNDLTEYLEKYLTGD